VQSHIYTQKNQVFRAWNKYFQCQNFDKHRKSQSLEQSTAFKYAISRQKILNINTYSESTIEYELFLNQVLFVL